MALAPTAFCGSRSRCRMRAARRRRSSRARPSRMATGPTCRCRPRSISSTSSQCEAGTRRPPLPLSSFPAGTYIAGWPPAASPAMLDRVVGLSSRCGARARARAHAPARPRPRTRVLLPRRRRGVGILYSLDSLGGKQHRHRARGSLKCVYVVCHVLRASAKRISALKTKGVPVFTLPSGDRLTHKALSAAGAARRGVGLREAPSPAPSPRPGRR
eukprot:scaffold8372_cov63-Phaeocystis_antarctica.AAC.1